MKKKITLILEMEESDKLFSSDKFILEDLKREINCCTNLYDFIDCQIEEI